MTADTSDRYYVYALVDPINRIPFYVGKGCGERAWHHLTGRDLGNKAKVKRIENIRALGFEPRVIILSEGMLEDDAYSLEASMILQAKQTFPYMTNVALDARPPSRKGCKMSEESVQKIAAANRRRQYKPMGESQKATLRQINLGKSWTEESKSKLSASITGRGFWIPQTLLAEMRRSMTVRQIADFYGVSVQPVKKCIRRYGRQSIQDNS
jgi:hypothetical protein